MPMRRVLLGCLVLTGCMPVAAQSLNADVEQVGASAYRIRITFPGVVAPDQAQAMLAEVGSHLCGGQAPDWGHYEFETTQPLPEAEGAQASTRFEQDLACGETVTIAKPGTPAPKTPATDADRRDIEARTLEYLSKKDHDEFAAADAMWEPEVVAEFDGAWHSRRAFNATAGLPATRTIVGVTFYDDPADAPRLGRHVAVDFRAAYGDRAFYCGYVVWLRQADGSYRLIREDEASASDEQVRELTAEQLAAFRQQPGCREPEPADA